LECADESELLAGIWADVRDSCFREGAGVRGRKWGKVKGKEMERGGWKRGKGRERREREEFCAVVNKKLSYRRKTAQCVVSDEILGCKILKCVTA